MKTFLKTCLVMMVGLSIFGCSSENNTTTPLPTVDFIYSGANLPAPSVITFTSITSNANTILWDFGDNSTSTLTNPQHTYTSGGVYTVKLTVTGEGGTTSTTKTVNVNSALTKVKITKITVTNLTFTKPGGTSGWDTGGSGPDLYFQIQDTKSAVLYNSKTTFNVADNITPSNLPLSWDLASNNVSFDITDLTVPRFINLFDYDTTALSDDDMSYVGFLFSNYTIGNSPYPSTITETQNGITITLNLSWY
jgi:PKD repeat protein